MAISKRTGRKVKAGRIADLRHVRNLLSLREAQDLAKMEPDDSWFHLRVQFETGRETDLLLTRFELLRAMKRAKDHPEDVPQVNRIRDALD